MNFPEIKIGLTSTTILRIEISFKYFLCKSSNFWLTNGDYLSFFLKRFSPLDYDLLFSFFMSMIKPWICSIFKYSCEIVPLSTYSQLRERSYCRYIYASATENSLHASSTRRKQSLPVRCRKLYISADFPEIILFYWAPGCKHDWIFSICNTRDKQF